MADQDDEIRSLVDAFVRREWMLFDLRMDEVREGAPLRGVAEAVAERIDDLVHDVVRRLANDRQTEVTGAVEISTDPRVRWGEGMPGHGAVIPWRPDRPV